MKTLLIEVEHAHRAILKVGAGLAFRYPSNLLFKEWNMLTVRQIFILHIILKNIPPYTIIRLRKKINSENWTYALLLYAALVAHKTSIDFLVTFCKIKLMIYIYPKNKYSYKWTLTLFPKTLDYQNTEDLLLIVK